MPKKSRRVAVRQAELGQRKRRSNRSGANAAAQAPAERVPAPTVQTSEDAVVATDATATVQAAPAPAAPVSASRPEPVPASATRPAAPYMMPELRRIGTLAVLMLVILGVLTAVLR